jgi:hypothetical protein
MKYLYMHADIHGYTVKQTREHINARGHTFVRKACTDTLTTTRTHTIDMCKMPALAQAVLWQRVDAVKTLLELGADRMIRSGPADSALHYAAEVSQNMWFLL